MADFTVSTVSGNVVIRADTLGTGQYVEYVKLMDGTAAGTNVWSISASGAGLVDINGTASVNQALATTGATSSVAAAGTSTTLKASNTNRKSIVIVNDGTGTLYILTATGTASTTNYTVKLDPGGLFYDDGYSGIVSGIWSPANGSARVTERT